jgi:hypothetical protein
MQNQFIQLFSETTYLVQKGHWRYLVQLHFTDGEEREKAVSVCEVVQLMESIELRPLKHSSVFLLSSIYGAIAVFPVGYWKPQYICHLVW